VNFVSVAFERFIESKIFSSDEKIILNFVTIEVQNIGRFSRFAQSLGLVTGICQPLSTIENNS
jgi:hypothetical protein